MSTLENLQSRLKKANHEITRMNRAMGKLDEDTRAHKDHAIEIKRQNKIKAELEVSIRALDPSALPAPEAPPAPETPEVPAEQPEEPDTDDPTA